MKDVAIPEQAQTPTALVFFIFITYTQLQKKVYTLSFGG